MFEDGATSCAGSHPLLSAAASIADVVAAALASSGLSLSLDDVHHGLAGLDAAEAGVAALRLHLVRLAEAREKESGHPGSSTVHWMTHTLRVSRGRAQADLAAARATDPERGALRGLGAALGAGEVSRAHVDVATRALRRLPTGLVRDEREQVDAVLTEHARSFSPATADVLARHLVAATHPEGLDAVADDAPERRCWSVRHDWSGMVVATGQLDPVGGAAYTAVLEHLAAPDRRRSTDAEGSAEVPEAPDTRTRAQRLADAQVEMAQLAAAALKLRTPTLEPARVVIHCTPEQLAQPDPGEDDGRPSPGAATSEQTGPVSARTLQTHACDALIERVVRDRHGALVRMESVGRLATRTQHRALAARDGGCAWPGCDAPPSWCEAHHVVWWSRGGATELTNLVLLCPRHHTEVHTEQWTIRMDAGVPWFVPPRWTDPDQVPVRNTVHTAVARARRAGQQLARGEPLDLGDADPPGESAA